MPVAHMRTMSLDQILQSTGTSLDELSGIVEQYREFTDPYPDTILANHFDVEDLATVIESLAGRLERIRTLVEPHLGQIGTTAHLAQAIDDVVAEAHGVSATSLVEKHLGIEDGPKGSGKLVAEHAVYGHPDYRYVVHGVFGSEPGHYGYVRHGYVVHLPTSSIDQALEAERAESAVQRISKLRAEANTPEGTERP